MNLSKSIGNYIKKKIFDPSDAIGDLSNIVGWHSVGSAGSSVYGFYKDRQYENGYSSITKLANGFAAVEPYAIDKTGKSVASNVLDRLYTPNTGMSAYDFREALAVTTLVHDKVRLRVHYKGVRITADSILGFTFMEGFSETIINNERRYNMQNGDVLTDAEVITLKSINPDEINEGFSASRAARRWTRLDDYIADYQKGFFENGAVPAGEMIITARTKTEYDDIVDMLQAKHKGAGKNNNITYVHRPTDTEGKPMNAQIEWVPFSSQNKDMALKDLFENVNKKIDSVYGVPAEIRGFLSNSNYASVSVAERVFVKYALDPMTMKIWNKFTHELNRITGGMGIAITYDLDIPQIADEEKVLSESKQVDASNITSLIEAGFSLDTIVDAFDYPESYRKLKLGKAAAATNKDEPQINDPDELKGTPSQPLDAFTKAIKEHIDARFDSLKKKSPMPVEEGHSRCLCCKGYGEHDTGFECYRCDASGSVSKSEALQPIPCDGFYEDGGRSHKAKKQIAVRDIPELYTDLTVDQAMVSDPSLRGCIMLKTEPLDVLDVVADSESDLASNVDMDRSPVPGETSPHVTLLYGLLNNGNIWKPAVDEVLDGWYSDTITVEEVGFFTLPDAYAIIAHIKKTSELVDAHDRLGLLPNAETFSEYKPHMTLAYIKKDADLGKWIKSLGEAYNGKELTTDGLDYGDKPAESKAVKPKLKKKQLSDKDRESYEAQLSAVVKHRMTVQVNKVIDALGSKAVSPDRPVEAAEDERLASEMLTVLIELIAVQGDIEQAINLNLLFNAGINIDDIAKFKMTPAQKAQYNAYVQKVATGYNAETAQKIRDIITEGRREQLTSAEIKDNLSEILAEEWRINRIAISEVNRAGNESSLFSMKNIAKTTGAKVEKVWVHDGGDTPCEFCRAMIGKTVPLNDVFLGMNKTLTGEDGGTFLNDFVPIEVAELHPNGHCRQVYQVV